MFNKPIEEMDYKELRNAVQVLYDAYEIQRRELADILENLGVDNFSGVFKKTLGNMSTSIEQTAEAIKLTATKEELEEKAQTIYEQTADAITTYAARQVDLDEAIEVEKISEMSDKSLVYKICQYADDDETIIGEKYYYYNDLSKEWVEMSGSNIYTIFQQTAEGFVFKGNVSIDGNLIVEGTVKSVANDVYLGNKNYMGLHRIFVGNLPVFSVFYNGDPAELVLSAIKIILEGDVDFSRASSVNGLGLPLVFR